MHFFKSDVHTIFKNVVVEIEMNTKHQKIIQKNGITL